MSSDSDLESWDTSTGVGGVLIMLDMSGLCTFLGKSSSMLLLLSSLICVLN